MSTQLIFFPPRLQFYLCHCSDGCQGFTTKAHGLQGEQIVGLADFGRGMTLKRQAGIRAGHSFSVIDYLYGGSSSILDKDVDFLGVGINSIFHKLFDDTCGALNHFTSGYLIGYDVG